MPLLSWRGLSREVRLHLPFWFLYADSVVLLYLVVARFPDSSFGASQLGRAPLTATIVSPLAWLWAYTLLRIRRSECPLHGWRAWLAAAVLLAAIPLLVAAGCRTDPVAPTQLSRLLEAMLLAWGVVLAAHAAWTGGRHALALFFGVGALYGLVLENTGIAMGFFSETRCRLYLRPFPAPLCTTIGWCIAFYVALSLVGQLARWVPWLAGTPWRRAWTATLLALCRDVQLDPASSLSGVLWRWNDQLPPVFLGVPAVNFAAWFGAFLPFSYFVFSIRDRSDLTESRKNRELLLRVPLSAALGGLLCFGVMAVVEGGFSGPTFRVLWQFVGRVLPR